MLVLMNGVEAFSFLTIGNARDSRAVTLGRKGCAAWPTARPRTGLTSLRASTEVIAIAKAAAAAGGDALLRPFWLNEIWGLTSVIILIGLLYEKAEKALKRAVPQTFLPVINAMLNELGALGFISALVFLSTHQGVGLSMLKKLAALFGSSMHHVIHDFELLHFALFAVVNLYFVQVLFVIFGVIKTYQKIEAFDKVQFSGGGSSPSKWEDRDSRIAIIKSMSMYQASKPDSSLQEKISRYVSNLFGWDRQIGGIVIPLML
ncbi:hypothetical protein GUITHDRAFT_106763 [Guillardia theta CCMP2712]|uniref:Uncharacterized protein n=1 Tax=Guillardia theta (strain CCMP2712) TaxID=905079 RepID=L1JFM3_GUITC|nr:hypothetical protein GUITHDRAFT_106763 [Guillardia theta CCMP2712]EKX47313.1 hypothetical protein GUITHDRAFT_106763 [Guillardia theta CCMP2712]|eukprot:XP_005834293.1 hypothetical protein GUITHDRAFT_106763 [Guillardia theta CCMP2712]